LSDSELLLIYSALNPQSNDLSSLPIIFKVLIDTTDLAVAVQVELLLQSQIFSPISQGIMVGGKPNGIGQIHNPATVAVAGWVVRHVALALARSCI
jgi:hypothetical protein